MRLLTSRVSFRYSVLVIALLVGTGLLSSSAHAASPSPAPTVDPASAAGLEISPATVDLNGTKGGLYSIPLKVHNVTKNTLTYTPSVSDFGAKDETGTVKLLPLGDLPSTESMISWIKSPLKSFTLKAGEIRTLTVSVIIPTNAEPGGHYGVISFTGATPEEQANSVGVKASTSLLILAKVAGTINENLTTASFYTQNSRGTQTGLFEIGPVTFVTRLKNSGNIHLQPNGTVEISDMFNRTVGIVKVNATGGNILPNSIRRFESTFSKAWMFGRYTADLTIGYGSKGQVLQAEIIFWVIPWRIVLVVLAVLATVVFIAWQLIKRYNRHIINKYKNSNANQSKKSKKRKD